MTISEDKVVTLSYVLSGNKDGGNEELIEQTSDDKPFTFLYGFGVVLKDFETNLEGKTKGDKFNFKIDAGNGYGIHEKSLVIKVERKAFEIDGKFDESRVREGQDVEMTDAEGNPLVGRITSVSDKDVELDFNHPYAGYDLNFKGEVLDVREATEEEIEHGHAHGPGGHNH